MTQPTIAFATNHSDMFICHEESQFYALCLQHLAFKRQLPQTVLEYGSGDGMPVLQALRGTQFEGNISGYEINKTAATLANINIQNSRVSHQYQVHNKCFFQSTRLATQDICLVSNPPYIPAPDTDNMLLPALWGGEDGADIMRTLLDQNASTVCVLLASISNPVAILRHALKQGYYIHQYLIAPIPFGMYTSQKHIRSWLAIMRQEGRAYFFSDFYLLAGVLFRTIPATQSNLGYSLLKILTCTEGE